jgi:hypothetical protein
VRIFFLVRFSVLMFFSVVMAGCVTHTQKMRGVFDELREGKEDQALERLERLAREPSRDQLLYQLEYGTLLHILGNHKKAVEEFIKADRLADAVDYYSISNMALATLTSEEMLQFKVTPHESLLINIHAALSFLKLGQFESAMVEVRRMQDKVNKIRQTAREDYEYNPFSHYLGGLLWEAQGHFDQAAISYEKAYDLDPSVSTLPEDLLRSNFLAGREQKLQQWKKKFPQLRIKPEWSSRNQGELIVLVAQGLGPEKVPNPTSPRFPMLRPRLSHWKAVELRMEGFPSMSSQVAYDVEQAALKAFEADLAWMAARRLGAYAAKEVLADQIRQKNELLGAVARLGLHLTERADLRQWTTLPQTFQVIRNYLPVGEYEIEIAPQATDGSLSSEMTIRETIQIKSRQKTFLYFRLRE